MLILFYKYKVIMLNVINIFDFNVIDMFTCNNFLCKLLLTLFIISVNYK